MYELKAKTEEVVKDSKALINDTLGDMFKSGAADIFEETDAMTMDVLTKYIALSNKLFDLAIAQAEVLEDVTKKLDEINDKLSK